MFLFLGERTMKTKNKPRIDAKQKTANKKILNKYNNRMNQPLIIDAKCIQTVAHTKHTHTQNVAHTALHHCKYAATVHFHTANWNNKLCKIWHFFPMRFKMKMKWTDFPLCYFVQSHSLSCSRSLRVSLSLSFGSVLFASTLRWRSSIFNVFN